jgi:hypothetical protein
MKERTLYLALSLVYLIPVWAVEYFPTTDGPAHAYNAWVLRQLGSPGSSWLDRYYQVDARPIPNWLGHAAMAGLMAAVPPRTAEKLLVSGYILLFLAGARYLAASVDPARGWLAFLAFPLAYSQLFQMGFYNFCLGLALFLFAVGLWWRKRDAPGWKLALQLNVLLILTWLAHLVAHSLALFALGALWLLTLRRDGSFRGRRHLVHLAILAPQAVLPLWFMAGQQGEMIWIERPMSVLWGYLLQMGAVFSLHPGELRVGMVLGIAFLVLLALTLRGRWLAERRSAWREGDAFLVLSVLFIALFFAAPEGGAGGTMLKHRIALFPSLLLLPWLAPELARRGRAVAVGCLTVLALAHAGFLLHWYRGADREIRALVAGAADIAPRSRVLPLLFDRDAPGWPGVLGHAFAYVAVEKNLLNWDNYETAAGVFPVRFRPGVRWPDSWTVEARPGDLDVEPWRDEIDSIYCWKMRPGSAVARRIERHYVLVAERGPARVYARAPLEAPLED